MTCDRPFLGAAVMTAIAGATLGEGTAHGWPVMIAARAALPARFPWPVIGWWPWKRWRP